MDKNAAYPKAVETLKEQKDLSKTTQLRQNKYLNNRVEQDHRFIKRLTLPGMGFHSFNTARRTLRGFEAMNMLRKGQVVGVEKGDVKARTERLRGTRLLFKAAPSDSVCVSNFWSGGLTRAN